MPFLRVIRDKRGYETTYLMHWFREGSRQHSKILYVFRSPGGVRVGRAPLEPDILKEIQRRYPDIEFDWHAVLENRQVVEPAAELRRPKKRRRPEDEERPAAAPTPPAASAAPSQTPRFVVPAHIEGETPDAQIAFLLHWYGAIRERVEQRASDPARREALLALCERLNPGNWTDADQITAGLPQAAEALERLSHVFAKRRRRSRKGKRPVPRNGAAVTADEPQIADEGGTDDEAGPVVEDLAASEPDDDSDQPA